MPNLTIIRSITQTKKNRNRWCARIRSRNLH